MIELFKNIIKYLNAGIYKWQKHASIKENNLFYFAEYIDNFFLLGYTVEQKESDNAQTERNVICPWRL